MPAMCQHHPGEWAAIRALEESGPLKDVRKFADLDRHNIILGPGLGICDEDLVLGGSENAIAKVFKLPPRRTSFSFLRDSLELALQFGPEFCVARLVAKIWRLTVFEISHLTQWCGSCCGSRWWVPYVLVWFVRWFCSSPEWCSSSYYVRLDRLFRVVCQVSRCVGSCCGSKWEELS